MNYAALAAELTTDPQGIGYAAMDDAAAAAALNDPANGAEVLVPDTPLRTNEIYAVLGLDATAVVGALETSNGPHSAAHRHFSAMIQPSSVHGVDIGHPVSQALVDVLVADGVMTAAQADAIKALGKRAASRAEQIGCAGVRAGTVQMARAL